MARVSITPRCSYEKIVVSIFSVVAFFIASIAIVKPAVVYTSVNVYGKYNIIDNLKKANANPTLLMIRDVNKPANKGESATRTDFTVNYGNPEDPLNGFMQCKFQVGIDSNNCVSVTPSVTGSAGSVNDEKVQVKYSVTYSDSSTPVIKVEINKVS